MVQILFFIPNTIKQSGSSDCGVFAAAYATSLTFGHNPCAFVYGRCRMREHLLRCLTQKKMEPFPYIRMRRTGTPCFQGVNVYTIIADAQTVGMQWCVVMAIHVESGSKLNTLTLL